jgi:Gluconate 2-dehydrogenase subunit 3
MNRRKAIGRIALVGIGGTLALGGYKWYDWNKTPDLSLLDRKKLLLGSLADTIIPPTDTPGARAAGVQSFIIMMLKDCTDRKTQNKFIEGLRDLEDYCLSSFKMPFDQCPPATQQAILAHFEKRDQPLKGIWGKAAARYIGRPFFVTLKDYTVQGYCSSQLGATEGLRYDPVPGSYHSCIPLRPGQPAWATK